MKFFKKIDDYLLHYFPSVWVTRVHLFLPIGIGIILLIYLGNIAIGWNPKNDRPDSDWLIFMMIIPVLVYLVYWFIFQSRYNVLKSGGKLSILKEYLNFFLYACVFTVAYFIIIVIPYSNDQKMMFAVGHDEVILDIEHLNDGNSIVNGDGSFEVIGNNKFRITESNFVGNYYHDYYYESNVYNSDNVVELTKRQVLERIANYITAYNKYTHNTIESSAEMILSDRISDNITYDDYDYYNYYDGSWSISSKVSKIRRLHEGSIYTVWGEDWFWKISFAFIGWLTLIVWIFKQMNLRHFVFGFISLCLTPIVAGIVGAIVIGLFYGSYRHSNLEDILFMLILMSYAIVAAIFIRGYLQDKLNQTAYVMSMYFNFWLPILPLFLYFTVISMNRHNFYSNRQILGFDTEDVLYWTCILVGLASVAIFKPVYAKFRSLPMQK